MVVLGELVRCDDVPSLIWNLGEGVEMTGAWLDEARQALQRGQQLWHICEQGQDYPWWGFKFTERYSLKLRDEIVGMLDKAKKQLERLVQVAGHYADQIGATGSLASSATCSGTRQTSVAWLLRAGELLETSPRPPAEWMSEPELPQLAADLEKCIEVHKQRSEARAPLTERYGIGVWNLPEGTAAGVDEAWHRAAPLLAPGDDKGAGLLTHQQQLRGWAADTQKRIPLWLTEARTIEKWLGVSLPRGAGASDEHDTSPHWLKRLLRLAHLCESENAPEKSWIIDQAACATAKAAIESNRPAFANYHATRKRLLLTYSEQFFELELDRIADGFAGPYQSWLRVFNMQYRRDRRAIARRTKHHQLPRCIQEDVVAARDLMREKARLERDQPSRQAVLGRYEKGLDTDCDAAERAVRIAEEAVAIFRELGHEQLPPKFVEALSAAGPPPEKIKAAIKRLQDAVSSWWHGTEDLKDYLPLDSLAGTKEALEESSLTALVRYAKDLQACLNHFATLADPVLTRAKSQPADAVTLVADLREAETLRHASRFRKAKTHSGPHALARRSKEWPRIGPCFARRWHGRHGSASTLERTCRHWPLCNWRLFLMAGLATSRTYVTLRNILRVPCTVWSCALNHQHQPAQTNPTDSLRCHLMTLRNA